VIVRFHCYRYLEQKKRKGAVFSNELVAILADEAEQINEVEHSQCRQALESCLGKLSHSERELVFAPCLHHGRITELAELGGTSANALYKKLGRLRDRLRNCVKERLAHA
jgi:RNA polymerase sigma-70 factor (ECF subfamily)